MHPRYVNHELEGGSIKCEVKVQGVLCHALDSSKLFAKFYTEEFHDI